MSNLWHETMDDLRQIEADIASNRDGFTVEQRLQLAQIHALLSISQELSSINPQNTTFFGEDGKKRNGWGLPSGER